FVVGFSLGALLDKRPRRPAATHHLPGGHTGIRQGHLPAPDGDGDPPGQGEISFSSLPGAGRWRLGNWEFLERHTDDQVVDFPHAPESRGRAAAVAFRAQPAAWGEWLDENCHPPKHERGGANVVLNRLKALARTRPWAKEDEDVVAAITYFTNQSRAGRMDYVRTVNASLSSEGSFSATSSPRRMTVGPPAIAALGVGQLFSSL